MRNRKYLSLILALTLAFTSVPVGTFAVSKPGKVKGVSASVTDKNTNTVKVKWKKLKKCSGYEVIVVEGGKEIKKIKVSGAKKTSKTIKNIESETGTVQFKVRAYNTYKVKKGKKKVTKYKYGTKSALSKAVSVIPAQKEEPKKEKETDENQNQESPAPSGGGGGGSSGGGGDSPQQPQEPQQPQQPEQPSQPEQQQQEQPSQQDDETEKEMPILDE